MWFVKLDCVEYRKSTDETECGAGMARVFGPIYIDVSTQPCMEILIYASQTNSYLVPADQGRPKSHCVHRRDESRRGMQLEPMDVGVLL